MAFCTKCGNPLPEGGRFCPKCGAAAAPAAKPGKTRSKRGLVILLILVGALVIGAGLTVLVDILDDGTFNLFGLLDSGEEGKDATEPEEYEWELQPYGDYEIYLSSDFRYSKWDDHFVNKARDTTVQVITQDLKSYCYKLNIMPTDKQEDIAWASLNYHTNQGFLCERYVTEQKNYTVIDFREDATVCFFEYPVGDQIVILRVKTTQDWDSFQDTWAEIVDNSKLGG